MEEDTLRAIEAPLRRLFASKDDDDDDNSDDLQPPAPPLPHQIVQFNFVAPCHPQLSEELESSYRTITLSLSVNPKPGCGGIAWPAGEVGQ